MKTIAALVIAAGLVACSPGAEPGSPTPARTADPTATPGRYTDAEQAAILAESIELLYATPPQAPWYPAYVDLIVEDRWAYLQTTLVDVSLAESMCADVAAATFDDGAESIGVTDVLIYGAGGDNLADCDVPER